MEEQIAVFRDFSDTENIATITLFTWGMMDKGELI